MWKNYDNASNDDDDNDDVKRIKFDQKSSLEPSAKVSKKSTHPFEFVFKLKY